MSQPRDDYIKSYRQEYKTRTKRVSITLSNAEYDALEYVAKAEGKKVTALVKEYAFASLSDGLAMPTHLQEELKQLSLLVRNIANNVNQIARHSNRVGDLIADDEQSLLTHLKSLENEIYAYTRRKLGEKK